MPMSRLQAVVQLSVGKNLQNSDTLSQTQDYGTISARVLIELLLVNWA